MPSTTSNPPGSSRNAAHGGAHREEEGLTHRGDAVVGDAVAVGDTVASVGDTVASVGDTVASVGDTVASVGDTVGSCHAEASSDAGSADEPQGPGWASITEEERGLGDGTAGPAGGDADAGPLHDPFARPGAHPPALAHSSRVAVALSLVSLITAVAAIAVLGWGMHRWQELASLDEAAEEDDDGSTRRARMRAGSDHADPEPPVDAPRRTASHDEGGITVVDLGIDAPSLDEALKEQWTIADDAGQTMLLMLTGRRCDPCRGLDASLSDPLMQDALAGVRLVRVDLEVFGEELSLLHLATDLYPSFFLVRRDLTVTDAIHGGEWDADIAVNIAPVLGPFVRGRYTERRHSDWAPTTTSVEL